MSTAGRRRIDRLVAALIAVVVLGVGVLIYLNSDIRATASIVGPTAGAPSSPTALPATLAQRWILPTNPDLGSVASPYGVVVTAADHTATGHDAVTGKFRWSYGRENLPLCAIGSGDDDALGVDRGGKVRGVMVVSQKDGFCSQVMLLDPDTGERHYYRTSPNQPGGSLTFGGPYAAWMGPTLVELWRNDLVRTIQYGDEPNPPKPDASHSGCTFTDIALADEQFATVEHCREHGDNARVAINWATPDSAPDKPDGQDVFKHEPRAEVDTGSRFARLVAVTQDRVAVLVSAPEPAVVVYDDKGKETSRTPVPIPADQIVAADGLDASGGTKPTPFVLDGDTRYSLIGDHLIAVTSQAATVPAPAETTSSGSTPPPTVSALAGASQSSAEAATVQVDDLVVQWTKPGALGLPAVIGSQLLMPVKGGLAVYLAATGNSGVPPSTIPVDRGAYAGRVDATAVGDMVIEARGDRVAGLS